MEGGFPQYGHCTLFGDGKVRMLGADGFAAAKRRDEVRRAELGWPVCESAVGKSQGDED